LISLLPKIESNESGQTRQATTDFEKILDDVLQSNSNCAIARLLHARSSSDSNRSWDSITIFAFLNALLLRPLPVRDPANLVQIFQLFPNLRAQGYFPLEMYGRLTDGSSTLFDVAGQSEVAVTLDNGAGPERVYVQAVTDNFFAALGIKAAVGTVFGSNDGAVAVLSYGYESAVSLHQTASRT